VSLVYHADFKGKVTFNRVCIKEKINWQDSHKAMTTMVVRSPDCRFEKETVIQVDFANK
jgi:hypothetical protein